MSVYDLGEEEAAPSGGPVAGNDFYKTNGIEHPGVDPGGVSMTRQEFARDCDINVLMERYQDQDIGAIMRRSQEPVYVDFTQMPSDLMGMMQAFDEAETAFMTLPAQVRREFDNDAARFVEYAADPANVEQMRTWGLAAPKPVEAQGGAVASPAPGGGAAVSSSPAASPSSSSSS